MSFLPNQKRGNLLVLLRKEFKELIFGKTMHKAEICQVLDIEPDFYETRLAGTVRSLLRQTHPERCDGEKSLYREPKVKRGVLCNVGDFPKYWHLDDKSMAKMTANMRMKIRRKFLDILPTLRLGRESVNANLEPVYYIDYYDADFVVIHPLKYEGKTCSLFFSRGSSI